MAAAMKLRTIRDQHVNATKAYNDRLMLAKSIEEKRLRTNNELEYNRLLGASQSPDGKLSRMIKNDASFFFERMRIFLIRFY